MRLDQMYKMTARIYGDRNSTRPKEATFAHFVEVCGMLTVHERGKRKEGFNLADALCKALGWYFPLLAKMRIESVEALLFRKYPLVCPYCRKSPHQDLVCKQVKGAEATVNHTDLRSLAQQNWHLRPATLDQWQQMFANIYPRDVQAGSKSVVALMEELGELGEAVRVYDLHPEYFLGEAADTFTYIMGIATEHQLREAQEDREFSFQDQYLARYPGLCMQCGAKVCVCPAVPSATVGRMAKELKIADDESPFIADLRKFECEGDESARIALEQAGGYSKIATSLPFDRGDLNHALVYLCLKIADLVEDGDEDFADRLRQEAVRIGANPSPAGSPNIPIDVANLLGELRSGWRSLTEEQQDQIKSSGGMIEGLGDALEVIRVLLVTSNAPSNAVSLNLAEEQRAIRRAIEGGESGSKIFLDEVPAARPDDLRQKLLRKEFDIVHFAGHANSKELIFVGDDGQEVAVELSAFAQVIVEYPIKCVILNACESIKDLVDPISPVTIGMDRSISDSAAISFSKGFYDALANGSNFERAFREGKNAIRLAGEDDSLVKMLT